MSDIQGDQIADDVRALADRLVDYMTTRTSPWRDEAVMREAVHATCSLLFGDAFYETELLVRKRVGS